MADSPGTYGSGYPGVAASGQSTARWAADDDGWAAPTHTVSAAGRRSGAVEPNGTAPGGTAQLPAAEAPASHAPSAHTPSAHTPSAHTPSAPAAEPVRRRATSRSARAASRAAVREQGVPGWLAVVVLIVIAGAGGLIDVLRGSSVKGAFNIALVVGSVVAILIVRRRAMFPVVVAPPLVYFVASALMLYVRSDGLHDRSRMLDAAINWLVYGFPAIAGATAAVLIIAGIRMIIHR